MPSTKCSLPVTRDVPVPLFNTKYSLGGNGWYWSDTDFMHEDWKIAYVTLKQLTKCQQQ